MSSREEDPRVRRSLRYDLTEGSPTAGVVARCRGLTQRALRAWFGPAGAPECRAVTDALLLVSEVVTNAATHGGAVSELRLDGTDRALWVQVRDTSPRRPRPHGPHRAGHPSGHGLYLLDRLATRWGSVPQASGGKTVWFEVEVLPDAGAAGGTGTAGRAGVGASGASGASGAEAGRSGAEGPDRAELRADRGEVRAHGHEVPRSAA